MELDDIDTTDVNLDDDFLEDWNLPLLRSQTFFRTYLNERDQIPFPHSFFLLYEKCNIAMLTYRFWKDSFRR